MRLKEMVLEGKTPLYGHEYRWLMDNKFTVVNTASKKLWEKFLIATKRTKGGKIEVYGSFAPAHFFEIKVIDKQGRYVVFSTGSGSLDRYTDKLMPLISEFLENMIVVDEIGGEV